MCRKKLYFRGMYKMIPKWEKERLDIAEQEAFEEVFNDIFNREPEARPAHELMEAASEYHSYDGPREALEGRETQEDHEDTDSESSETDSDISEDSDTDSWFTYDNWEDDEPNESEEILEEIQFIQERFRRIQQSGYTVSADLLGGYYYDIATTHDHYFYEDSSTHKKNLFISKYEVTDCNEEPIQYHHQTRPRDAFETISVTVLVC